LLGEFVQYIHQSNDGKLWVATSKGLNLYFPEGIKFKYFDKNNVFPTSLIRAIEDDVNDDLWLTTNKGISKLNPEFDLITNFDKNDGLLGSNYYANSLVNGKGETFFTCSQRSIEFFKTTNMEGNSREFTFILTASVKWVNLLN
jgi:ligand-binding sensor domain-containing protein